MPATDLEIEAWNQVYTTAVEPVKVAKLVQIETYDDESNSCLDEEWATNECLQGSLTESGGQPVLADLPRDVFAPAPRPAALAAEAFPRVMPAIGSLRYLAMKPAASVASPAEPTTKALAGPIPAIGTLVYLSRSWNSSPLAAANPVVVRASETARPIDFDELPRDVFADLPRDVSADLPRDRPSRLRRRISPRSRFQRYILLRARNPSRRGWVTRSSSLGGPGQRGLARVDRARAGRRFAALVNCSRQMPVE